MIHRSLALVRFLLTMARNGILAVTWECICLWHKLHSAWSSHNNASKIFTYFWYFKC